MNERPALAVLRAATAIAALFFAGHTLAADWPPSVCSEAKKKCFIKVNVTADVVTVDPEPVETPRTTQKVKLIWKLPVGYAFSRPNGDGIEFKASQSEFEDPDVLEDNETTPSQAPHRRFKWVVTKKLPAPREYKLIFHEYVGGLLKRRFDCDPTIANFDGNAFDRGNRYGKGESKVKATARAVSAPLSCTTTK